MPTNQAHYRMVDSRQLNEPLTDIATACDDILTHIVWGGDAVNKRDLVALVNVIRAHQSAICQLAFDTNQTPV